MSRRTNKYIAFSTIVHGILLLLVFFNFTFNEKQSNKNEDTPKIETGITEIEIIDLGDSQEKTTINPESYFWGIGIDTTETFTNFPGQGEIVVIHVTNVKHGYSAEQYGILSGDDIILLDGKPIFGENDIKGDEPKNLSLTIIRNGNTIVINLPRVKVYY